MRASVLDEWISEPIMKTTRVLLADKSGVLCEAATRLPRILPNFSTGVCTVRSADTLEPLTRWHPDLVLLDPNRDECDEAAPDPHAKARSRASRVLVLSLSYGDKPDAPRQPSRRASRGPEAAADEPWYLASATIQAVELEPAVQADDVLSAARECWVSSTDASYA